MGEVDRLAGKLFRRDRVRAGLSLPVVTDVLMKVLMKVFWGRWVTILDEETASRDEETEKGSLSDTDQANSTPSAPSVSISFLTIGNQIST